MPAPKLFALWRESKITRWRHSLIQYFLLACAGFLVLSILLTLPLRWFNPATTAFILADSSVDKTAERRWVSYDEVSDQLLLAIISSEDQLFFKHWGIDFASIKKSLGEDRTRARGASTISQQLTKNLYLWSGRSYWRKALEAWLTLCLETFLSKQRILEIYINVVEFGEGVYGAEQASQSFFNKPASALTRLEASLLAAVLPNPKRYSAKTPSNYVRQRARDIRRWMPDMRLMYEPYWP